MKSSLIDALNIANKTDWNILNCHDRALALASSMYDSNNLWGFLFCQYKATNALKTYNDKSHGDIDYYDYIEKKLGVKFNRRSCLLEELFDYLMVNARKKTPVVLIINNKYRPMSKHYQKKNHPHFVFLIDFFCNGKEVEILDEPMEEEYWRSKNFTNGVEYEFQRIKVDDLAQWTNESKVFAEALGFEAHGGNDKVYYYTVDKTKDVVIDPKELLLSEISFALDDQESHLEYIIESLNSFNKMYLDRYINFPAISPQMLATLNDNDPSGLKSQMYYPFEWKKVEFHHIFLSRIQLYIHVFGASDTVKLELQNLITQYNLLKMNLCKSIIKKDFGKLQELINHYSEIYSKQMILFECMKGDLA